MYSSRTLCARGVRWRARRGRVCERSLRICGVTDGGCGSGDDDDAAGGCIDDDDDDAGGVDYGDSDDDDDNDHEEHENDNDE